MHELGVDHLRAVVGASMGGMSALAYALQYPDEMDDLASISAAPRALPFTIAMRSLQREAIRSDPAWKEGRYRYDEEPLAGMLLARKLGLMSYRSAEEWHRRFNRARVPRQRRARSPFAIEFEVESYLDYNARKFIGRFDANTYLYLSRALDLFDVADHGGTVNAGLARIHARRTLIVGVESDILFPIDQQRQIAEGLRKAGREVAFVVLDSINGHDSFLVDADHFAPVMARFFAEV
jgi:homoserine O-acetyltransferase